MDIPIWLQIIFMIISAVLSIVVAYLGRRITKEQERRDVAEEKIAKEEHAIKSGIRAILRDRLLYICAQCEKRGSVTVEQLQNVSELFESYSSLGGNGAAKKIFEDVLRLPLDKGGESR
jgi:hypothetical protein